MKVLSIVGARPQFVKAAVVSRALHATPDATESILHTGQHYDDSLSRVFFDALGIPPPKFNLGVRETTHAAQSAEMLKGIENAILGEKPDWVLIYGDTNSTLAGALAAAKLRVPLAHVEAGLRSFNRRMPEEINRILADRASDLLFAPTPAAVENLAREGIDPDRVLRVGDVMYDAALHYGERARSESQLCRDLGLQAGQFVVATIHRQENTDDERRLRAIFGGLEDLADRTTVVVPLHPRTRKALDAFGIEPASRLRIVPPLGYLDMLALESAAQLIATDSGGVQKEAYFFRTPCVTLRDETEWVELVGAGWNRLAPPVSREAVSSALAEALATPPPPWNEGNCRKWFGDGDASGKIARALRERAA